MKTRESVEPLAQKVTKEKSKPLQLAGSLRARAAVTFPILHFSSFGGRFAALWACLLWLAWVPVLEAATTTVTCPGLQTGVAPISPPIGGFGIDGELIANTPMSGVGDWLPDSSGLGGV